jgi:rod shape-determining protein MreD
MKYALLVIFSFYILVLLQSSFLVPLNILGRIPNFAVLAVILINFLEKPAQKLGIISGFFGGFFIDIFSQSFLGFYTLVLLAVSFFIKYILRSHIRIWT